MRLDTGFGKHGGDRIGLVDVVQEVSEGNPSVGTVVDDARLAAVDADKRQATEDALGAEPLGELLLDAESIHQGQHERVGTDTGANESLGLIHRGGLQGAEYQVGATDLLGFVIGLGGDMEITIATDDVEPAVPDGFQVAPHDKVDIVPDTGQAGAVETADRARSDDGDFDPLPSRVCELENGGLA